MIKVLLPYKAHLCKSMKFLILLSCLVIAASNLHAAEQAFQVQGVLEQYNGSKLTQTYHFTALVKDCQWLIHTVPEKATGLKYYEDSYDGKYIYHYLQFQGAPAKNVANSSGGAVEANDIPNNKADYVVATWLAYGSFCYFNKVKENKVKPFFDWFEPNASELNKLVTVDLKRSEKPPFVPTFIYAKDFNRRYRVLDFTNFSGLLLPKEFVVECFNPYSDISTTPPTFSYRGLLTGIASVEEELSDQDFRPNLDGRTYTEDRRFAQKTSVASELTYLNKSNQWLPTNNPQLVALYHQQLLLQAPESNIPPPNRVLVFILLACPTIAFVIFEIVHWKRSRKNTHGTDV